MEDGSKVVGLFNRGDQETAMTVQWPEVGVRGKQAVRDLWRQKDLARSRTGSPPRSDGTAWC